MNNSNTKGLYYLTLSSLIFVITSYITNVILGRFLGPETYGVYGVIISLLTTLNLIQNAGLPQAVVKYISSDSKNTNSIYTSGLKIQLYSTIILSCLFYLSSNLIAQALKDIQLIPYLQLAAFIFPVYGIFTLLTAYYNGIRDFKKQASIHNIYSFGKMFLVLIFAYTYNLYGIIVGFILSPILAIITAFKMPPNVASIYSKKLILFSIPLIGISIFTNLLQSIDLFFVKSLIADKTAPGYYTASQTISKIPLYALIAFSSVILPNISQSVANNLVKETQETIKKFTRISLIICLPLALTISATSGPLIEFIYSKEYFPATNSLSILSLGMGFLSIYTIYCNILNGAHKPNIPLFITIISLIILSILCVILIPIYGLTGAALATTISGFIAMVSILLIVYFNFKAVMNLTDFMKIVIASIIIYIVGILSNNVSIFLPIKYMVLIVIYVSLLFVFKEITHKDILIVKSLMPNRLKQ